MIAQSIKTFFLKHTPSTMDVAKQLSKNNKNEIFSVITKLQTAGRGRNGSIWEQIDIDKKNESNNFESEIETYKTGEEFYKTQIDIYPITYAFPANKIKVPIEWISTLVGCALYDSFELTRNFIKSLVHDIPFNEKVKTYIKWPNDIIISENLNSQDEISYKKISGILCESSSINQKIEEIYIGIGVNFFQSPSIESASSFWQTLFLSHSKNDRREINKYFNSNEFRSAVVLKFYESLNKEIQDYLCSYKNVEQLKSLALKRSVPIGTFLSVDKGTRRGSFSGLDDNAGLLLNQDKVGILSGNIEINKTPILASKKVTTEKQIEKQEQAKKITPALTIDFGNTNIHLGYLSSNNETLHTHIPYEPILSNQKNKIRDFFQDLLPALIADRKERIHFLYSSVNTTEKTNISINRIKEYLNSIFPEMKFDEFKITEKEIFSVIDIKGNFEKSRLGADRALKFLFASKKSQELKENIVVFSFGTAVTCEGVSKENNILENFIFPGIQMSFNALNHFTALVPLFHADSTKYEPKDQIWDQEIYIQRGIFLSTASSVLSTLKMHQPARCFFSGGNSADILKIINTLEPNHKFSIEILPSIENLMLTKYRNELIADKVKSLGIQNIGFKIPPIAIQPPNLKEKLISKKDVNNSSLKVTDNENNDPVFQSMLKARSPNSIERNKEPALDDFRKLGTILENISEEERLDAYLSNKFQFHKRDVWRQRILDGEVLIQHGAHKKQDKKPHLNKIKPTYRLKNYDQIWLFHPNEYEPDTLDDLNVVADDGDICVFSKPPNMVIHAAGIYGKNTFVNLAAKMGYGDCSAVHRIDRETSGILVCARKSETRNLISDEFRNGQIKKMYLAVTKGTREVPDYFKVTLPIGEPENSLIRLKLWVTGNNLQNAETYFAKIATHEDYSLFACLPQTGRTNQIRIHLAATGHWIVGDKMYHKNENVFIEFYEKGYTQWVHEQTLFPRHMLHNAGIQTSNSNLSILSEKPIVCELYSDMLQSDIVKNLFRNAGISASIEDQQVYLRNLFTKLCDYNFNTSEDIKEEV